MYKEKVETRAKVCNWLTNTWKESHENKKFNKSYVFYSALNLGFQNHVMMGKMIFATDYHKLNINPTFLDQSWDCP